MHRHEKETRLVTTHHSWISTWCMSVLETKTHLMGISIVYFFGWFFPGGSGQQISDSPCIAQVLETIKKNACAPKPFPLHEQYVPAVMAARGDNAGSDDDTDDGGHDTNRRGKGGKSAPPKKKPKAKTKGVKRQPAKSEVKGSDWQYGEIRTMFMNNHRAKGNTYAQAKRLWDDSTEKAQILSLVSVQELRQRRFLAKGATENPWLQKLRGST